MTTTKELIELERWGRSANLCLRLLDQMDDGYWTPWHIATEAVTALQSKVESLSAEVERLRAQLEAQGEAVADRYVWECHEQWAHGWGWEECTTDFDPRLPEYKQYYAKEDWNDPDQIRNFRALYTHPAPAAPAQPKARIQSLEELTEWLDGLGGKIHTYSLRGIALAAWEARDNAIQKGQQS